MAWQQYIPEAEQFLKTKTICKESDSHFAEYRDLVAKGINFFHITDTDRSGSVSQDELTAKFEAHGHSNAGSYFSFCDVDNDGKVTKLELCRALACNGMETVAEKDFRMCDCDNNGNLNAEEFKRFFAKFFDMGKCPPAELEKYKRKWDADGDDGLSFDEVKVALNELTSTKCKA